MKKKRSEPKSYFQCDNCSFVTTAPTSDVKQVGHPMCPNCTDRETEEITYKEYRAIDYTHGLEDGEGVIKLPTGQYAVFESAEMNPKGTSYVRIIDDKGQELAYWDSAEWCESGEQAIEVMGAIFGAMQHGANC
jgi:hypothetical protein